MASLCIPASQLPAISAVVTVLVNRYGTVERIPNQEWQRLLPAEVAGAVCAVVANMDCDYPSPSAVMRAIAECAALTPS